MLPFEDLGWAGDAACREEDGFDGAEGGERVRKALPLRERAGTGHPERVQCCSGDRDGIPGLRLGKAERLRRPSRGRVRALGRVVETLVSHGGLVGEAAVHLIGDRERRQELAPGRARVLGRREHRRQVVARVAGLAGREVGVVEVEVADECAVVERRPVRGGPAAPDQRAQRPAAEVVELGANRVHRRSPKRPQRAAERIQNADLQLVARVIGEVFPGPLDDEAREARDKRHGEPPPSRRPASAPVSPPSTTSDSTARACASKVEHTASSTRTVAASVACERR